MSANKTIGLRRLVIGAVFSILALVLGTASVSSAAGDTPPTSNGDTDFAAQARSLGLTDAEAKALQETVDSYLARTGGTQVAVNKIQLVGADIFVVLPGEQVARDITAAPAPMSACQYGHLCAYSGQNFLDSVIDMYDCGTYSIPWTSTGSWDNNQVTGTRAQFRDINGAVGYVSPGAHSLDLSAQWGWVYSITNC